MKSLQSTDREYPFVNVRQSHCLEIACVSHSLKIKKHEIKSEIISLSSYAIKPPAPSLSLIYLSVRVCVCVSMKRFLVFMSSSMRLSTRWSLNQSKVVVLFLCL